MEPFKGVRSWGSFTWATKKYRCQALKLANNCGKDLVSSHVGIK